ncbi:MAG: hypothetical protein HRT35_12595 [Algicola sp.]|nr:hypothetical protein [Algicola sp.]
MLLIRDENALGTVYNELKLSFDKVEVSVQDIITERVFQEVDKYNQQAQGYLHGLVQPIGKSQTGKPSKKQPINAELQVAIALKAFANNVFFILIDDLQAESLSQLITIKSNTMVSFVKLTPLVGG